MLPLLPEADMKQRNTRCLPGADRMANVLQFADHQSTEVFLNICVPKGVQA